MTLNTIINSTVGSEWRTDLHWARLPSEQSLVGGCCDRQGSFHQASSDAWVPRRKKTDRQRGAGSESYGHHFGSGQPTLISLKLTFHFNNLFNKRDLGKY